MCHDGKAPPARSLTALAPPPPARPPPPLAQNIFLLTEPGSTLFNSGNLFPIANETYAGNVYWAAPSANAAPSALRFPIPPYNNATFEQWQAAGEDGTGALADPLVPGVAAGDFTVLPGSPALARGFVQLKLGWGPQ